MVLQSVTNIKGKGLENAVGALLYLIVGLKWYLVFDSTNKFFKYYFKFLVKISNISVGELANLQCCQLVLTNKENLTFLQPYLSHDSFLIRRRAISKSEATPEALSSVPEVPLI